VWVTYDQRLQITSCSNMNNEKFSYQSLQQLKYRATQQVLFKKKCKFYLKITLKS